MLNIGLNAGILNAPVFAMFVLMGRSCLCLTCSEAHAIYAALVTTFATTPLTLLFYPVWYREQLAAERAQKGLEADTEKDDFGNLTKEPHVRSRFLIVLNRMEHLSPMMSFTKLLQRPVDYGSTTSSLTAVSTKEESSSPLPTTRSGKLVERQPVAINALRLLELSERTSAVMRATDLEETARNDPLCNIYSTFAGLNGFQLTPKMSIVPSEEFSESVASFSKSKSTDMIIVPWTAGASNQAYEDGPATNPFASLFQAAAGSSFGSIDRSPQYAAFVREVFLKSTCDVGLFLDRGLSGVPPAIPAGRQHIFLPFHGGPDDRTALDLVLQLCRHPGVSATIARISRVAEPTPDDLALMDSKDFSSTGSLAGETAGTSVPAMTQYTVHAGAGADTVYGTQAPGHQLASDTADNLALAHFFPSDSAELDTRSSEVRNALSRVTMISVSTCAPLRASLAHAKRIAAETDSPLLIVTGRSRRHAASHRDELAQYLKEHVAASASAGVSSLGLAASSEVRKSLGDVASALVVASLAGSLLVVQAGEGKPSATIEV